MKWNVMIVLLALAIFYCYSVQGLPVQQTNFQSIISPGIVNPISVTQGASDGASSNAQTQASWSEEPLSGASATQGMVQGITPTSLQVNFTNSAGQNLGQIITPGAAQSQNASAVMQYSQYFKITPNAPSKPLTGPAKFEISGRMPTTLYFGGAGAQKAVPYSQYQSYATYIGQNTFWIQGQSSWTQYATVPQGSSLNLLATTSGGYGYLYEIYPDGTLDKEGYYFYPYDQIGFYADQVGQHLLMFVVDGQPSNIVVIDVVSYQPPPPVYSYAGVIVSSNWLLGYNVYVDGNYQVTEGMTGEAPGVVSFIVPGNQYHTISIQGSGFSYSNYKYFNAGTAYTLTV